MCRNIVALDRFMCVDDVTLYQLPPSRPGKQNIEEIHYIENQLALSGYHKQHAAVSCHLYFSVVNGHIYFLFLWMTEVIVATLHPLKPVWGILFVMQC